ncbi:MAG TPA: aminopeptidase P N-terminal domain-containing protein [Candidatus Saccharimonadales bacterium]|nr:aminopeptidase P N-terminal domain-containing protein [Candidatus Saccharimonadales bacterium]
MKSHFSSKFFTGNRTQLREARDGGLIVVGGNGLMQRGADSVYKFAQDANFWYLTGIDEPEIVLVMDGAEEYLILSGQSDYQKTFDGTASESELAKRSSIRNIYGSHEGWEKLAARLKKTKRVATIAPPPAYIDLYGMYTNPARPALVKKLKSHCKSLKVEDAAIHLVRQRVIKQPEEIAAIQAAINITVASLRDALPGKYKYEYELEAEIAAGFRKRGAAGHAFEPIVAAGKRACTLHNVANDSAIGKDDLVVVDVGAEVEHYAADITRTASFGRPSRRQQAVYNAVLEAQKFAISLIKPGLEFKDYRRQTDQFIGEKLRELGLIKTITAKNIRKYYPHSISHFLGLNVHDVGDYAQPLQPGMVLTVEPGIYIPEEAIGVRIEDDILITEKSVKILSGKLPRGLG